MLQKFTAFFMINFNGDLVSSNDNLLANNRGFLYGDAVFETLKIIDNQILFLEEHYFRLMSSMRILRMEIPMNFTLEFFEEQILSLTNANKLEASARIRFTVFRKSGGYYLPETNDINFLISVKQLDNKLYIFDNSKYEVDLFKDFYVSKHLLSTLKTTNKLINITGSIFAKENNLDNCLLINESKNIVESLNGNIFMLLNNKLITPPISEGCLNGIIRKKIIELAKKTENLEVLEAVISPFDLQKADELFITNIIKGIQPITQYRKKSFDSKISEMLLSQLNKKIVVS